MESTDRLTAAIKSENLLAVYATWKEVTADRMAPRRAEVSPARLKRATSWTFTVDVIDGGTDFRFGFAGDRMMQFLQHGCATPMISGLRGDHFFDVAHTLFRRCVESRKPLISGPYPTRYRGKEHLERQVLILPLSEDGVAVSGLLGAFDTWLLGTNRHVWEPVLAA